MLSNQRHESLFGKNGSLTLLLVLFFFFFKSRAWQSRIPFTLLLANRSLCASWSWLPVTFSTCHVLDSPSKSSSERRLKCHVPVHWVLWWWLLGSKVKLCSHLQGPHQSGAGWLHLLIFGDPLCGSMMCQVVSSVAWLWKWVQSKFFV